MRSSGSRPAVGSSNDEQLGVVEQCLRDADAAAHAAGVPAELAVAGVGEVDQLQQLADPPAPV